MQDKQRYENPDLWKADEFETSDQQVRFAITASLIPADAKSLLDIGCGNGAFMAFLEQRSSSIQMLGVERSNAARDAAICSSLVVDGSIDSLQYDDRTFDLLSALEVIEHLPWGVYEQALKEMERVARKYILISVPYRETRQVVKCPYCNCRFDSNYHMRRFDEIRMEQLFRNYRCVKHQLVSIPDYLFAPIFRTGYALVSGRNNFPKTALCPQCGFAGNSVANKTLETPQARTRSQLRTLLKDRLPKYQRANWIVGLYQRTEI